MAPRLVAGLSLVALSACSLSISAPAANRKRLETPVCDSSKGLVALDTLAAIGFGIGGLAALSDNQSTGAIALVGAALFTATALHGSNNANKCKEALADYAKETQDVVERDQLARRAKHRARQEEPDEQDPADEPAPRVPMPPRHLATEPPAVIPTTPATPTPTPTPKPRLTRTDDWSQFWREMP